MNYIVKNCFLQLAAQVLTIGGGTGGRIGLGPPTFISGGPGLPTFKFRILPKYV